MQLPENIQPIASAVGKYHFWILALVVPLLIVPMLVLANSDISKKIDGAQSNISSKISAVDSVRSTSPHPNQEWAEEIEQQTLQIRQDTWRSWDQAYQQQQQIRVWPDALGQQFLRYINRLGPEDQLPLPQRELYQNTVPAIVKSLPARMGAEDLMDSGAGLNGLGGSGGIGYGGMSAMMGSGMSSMGLGGMGGSGPGESGGFMGNMGPRPMVDWSAADQARIYQSFVWEKTPTTTQILLAQEELWVYGVLCDAIALANSRSTGHYNAAVPTVEEMAIGYHAAEGQPGGEDSGRITLPGGGGGQGDMMGGPGGSMGMMSMGGGGPIGGLAGGPGLGGGLEGGGGLMRPSHPRFGGVSSGDASGSMGMSSMGMGMGMGGGGGMGMMGGGSGGSSVDPEEFDESLYNWIYVDFDGKPLTKSDIDSSPSNRMLRLMPFRLRIRIGEQKLDGFLVELATQAPVPIDVRQVRINPNGGGGIGGASLGAGMGSMGLGASSSRSSRGGAMGGTMSPGMGPSGMGSLGIGGMGGEGMGYGEGGGLDGGRPSDLDVEIRGTIAIVVQPDPEIVGLAEDEIPRPQQDVPPGGDAMPANTNENEFSDGGVS